MKKIDVTNIIFYDEEGRFLMHKRPEDVKIYPNHWGLFGGKIEEKEDVFLALKREIFEEIDYELEEMNYSFDLDYKIENICYGRWFIFIKKIDEKEKEKMRFLDRGDWSWVSSEKREKLLINDDMKKVLLRAEKEIENEVLLKR